MPTRGEIETFFQDAIVDGVSRNVVFLENSEEGRIEVDLVAPPNLTMPTVHISFPDEGKGE